MSLLSGLKKEMEKRPDGVYCPDHFRCVGYKRSAASDISDIRADGISALFTDASPYIYKNDLIVGSI